jgi:dihydroxyacetone kinase-like predicted kinase
VGDVLGIVNGDVVEVGAELDVVGKRIIDRLVASGGELVTLVTGADATADLAATLRRRVGREHPGIDVVVYEGGQPLWPLIVGVE